MQKNSCGMLEILLLYILQITLIQCFYRVSEVGIGHAAMN